MKRVVLTGVVAFLLGSISMPRAASRDESLDIACARLKKAKSNAARSPDMISKQLGGKMSEEAAATVETSLWLTLEIMEQTLCVK